MRQRRQSCYPLVSFPDTNTKGGSGPGAGTSIKSPQQLTRIQFLALCLPDENRSMSTSGLTAQPSVAPGYTIKLCITVGVKSFREPDDSVSITSTRTQNYSRFRFLKITTKFRGSYLAWWVEMPPGTCPTCSRVPGFKPQLCCFLLPADVYLGGNR